MLLIPIAFLTYCPWPFEHTAHDLWRIRQQETFVVDQSFGIGGTGARCGGAPEVPFTQVKMPGHSMAVVFLDPAVVLTKM